MRMTCTLVMALICVTPLGLRAGDELTPTTATLSKMSSITSANTSTRYGLFDGLDSRSSYGQGAYPEPFLVDDTDLEVNEARLDWLHTAGEGNSHSDVITAEVEKGFGNLTLEIEAPLERDSEGGQVSTNFSNIDLGARYPLYEYVDTRNDLDTTFGVAAEVGVPVGSVIARNTEVVPKIFNDTKWHDFTLQTIIGYSTFVGHSGDDGAVQTLEYGFVFGYTIDHDTLAIPGLQALIPVFEISGERQMNKDDHGNSSVLANAGFRANLKPIGSVQPRLGLGYVFPLDYGAHADVHWGIFTSLVFEY